jgi:hypothetical protein
MPGTPRIYELLPLFAQRSCSGIQEARVIKPLEKLGDGRNDLIVWVRGCIQIPRLWAPLC